MKTCKIATVNPLIFIILIGILLRTARADSTLCLVEGSPGNCYEVKTEDGKQLLDRPAYNASLPTCIVMAGFEGKRTGPCMLLLIDALLKSGACNVMFFTYQTFSCSALGLLKSICYPEVAKDGLKKAVILGNTLVEMDATGKFRLNETTIVAFSLGSHVAGETGRAVKNKNKVLIRILACDANSQLFYQPTLLPRVSKDCALRVDAIHTDYRVGINASVGSADYYTNYYITISGLSYNKEVQEGCPERNLDMYSADSLCSHNRCIQVLVQSFTTTFEAGKAASYWAYKAGQITDISRVGFYSDPNASGDYFYNTSGCTPYTLGTSCPNAGAHIEYYCQPT